MKNKRTKTTTKVKFNTALFVLAALIFAAISFASALYINNANDNLRLTIHNTPHVCFDEKDYSVEEGHRYIENAYLCGVGEEKISDLSQLGLYVNSVAELNETLLQEAIGWGVLVIGGMLTIASFFGAIIYWNHNKIK